MDIPFEYVNNFIILNLTINKRLPLKFIFDTGAEHTILSKREISDLLNIRYEREFKFTGSDMKTELIAYLARDIRFDITEKTAAPKEDIFVLQEDYFRFEEYAGINIHGILAAGVFSKFIIKINYQKQIITLYDRKYFKLHEDGFVPIPVEIFRNKIYFHTRIQVVPDSFAPVKLLLDTGAGLSLLLFSNTHPLVHPPANAISSNIGMGLGGYLEGFTGRIVSLDFGPGTQQNVITYFQELDTTRDLQYLNNRNGLIGNTLLNRYQIIMDYEGEKIWLKPTKDVRKAFVYDRSGISFIASGATLSTFAVQNVVPRSPAAEVDIRPGDILVRVGATPASFLSLQEVQNKLRKSPGKEIKLTLKRDGKRLKKKLVLRDLI